MRYPCCLLAQAILLLAGCGGASPSDAPLLPAPKIALAGPGGAASGTFEIEAGALGGPFTAVLVSAAGEPLKDKFLSLVASPGAIQGLASSKGASTDSNGQLQFSYQAPDDVTEPTDAAITASVQIDESAKIEQAYRLHVVAAKAPVLTLEGPSDIAPGVAQPGFSVAVARHDGQAVAGACVKLSSSLGSIGPLPTVNCGSGTQGYVSDAAGRVAFVYNAPASVDADTEVTLSASAIVAHQSGSGSMKTSVRADVFQFTAPAIGVPLLTGSAQRQALQFLWTRAPQTLNAGDGVDGKLLLSASGNARLALGEDQSGTQSLSTSTLASAGGNLAQAVFVFGSSAGSGGIVATDTASGHSTTLLLQFVGRPAQIDLQASPLSVQPSPSESRFSNLSTTVLDQTGKPMGGVKLASTVLAGAAGDAGGSVSPTSLSTDQNGQAKFRYEASSTSGTARVQVKVDGSDLASVREIAVAYPPDAPVITAIDPVVGTVGTGVTLSGRNLDTASQVSFRGVASLNAGASSFVNVDPAGTYLTVGVPAGIKPGAMSVVLKSADGSATAPLVFTVIATPASPIITAVSPMSAAPGAEVSIAGNNLGAALVASFNGVPAGRPTQVTASSLKLTVPEGASSGLVAISTPGGTAYSASEFTVSGTSNAVLGIGSYSVSNGRIKDPSGRVLQVRGINVFGFNTGDLLPQYLWAMNWQQQLRQIKGLGFNAVRVPIIPLTLYSTATVNSGVPGAPSVSVSANPDLVGLTPQQVLDKWISYADSLGLYVLIDMHGSSAKLAIPTWFNTTYPDYTPDGKATTWNGQPYTQADWLDDLAFVARRYAALPHFMALDVFNEPHGDVRWNTGDNPANYWKPAVESAAAAILAANPNLLIFVQGAGPNYDGLEHSDVPMNFGENFQPQAYSPLDIPVNKLVLAPHTYGPDLYLKTSVIAASFPDNLAADWDTLFGQFYPKHAVIPGEWGGLYGQNDSSSSSQVPDPRDIIWMKAFVNWMVARGNSNSFLWNYYPNSDKTGGVLTDDPFTDAMGVRTDKMDLLLHLWNGTPME